MASPAAGFNHGYSGGRRYAAAWPPSAYPNEKHSRVRRAQLPRALLNHLLDRIRDREISAGQPGLLADWLDREPVMPTGKWFKRFPGMIVCGEGELVKTFLRLGQIADGEEAR